VRAAASVLGAWVVFTPGLGRVGVTATVGVISAEGLALLQLTRNNARSNKMKQRFLLNMLFSLNQLTILP
jgi:hypothetical protein